MPMIRLLLAIVVALGACASAMAQPCFDPMGAMSTDCPTRPSDSIGPQKNGEVILNDEKGRPLLQAIVVPGAKKRDRPLAGIADMAGRQIVQPRFDRVYAVSQNVAVGEARTDAKGDFGSTRAFLIDVKSGELRATPWFRILPTQAYTVDSPPYLLGVLPETTSRPFNVAVITATGTDTGLRFDGISPTVFDGVIRTLPYGLIGMKDQIVNVRGEEPFAGREIVTPGGGAGFFVKSGPPPAEVKGTGIGPLLTPLASNATPQVHPADLIGMVKGGSYLWFIRRTPKGIRFYQHGGGRPDLAAPPVGEGYLDLYLTDRLAIVRTPAGWIDPYVRKPFPTPEAAVAAREAELKAFMAAVRAEDKARNPHLYPKSAAEVAAEKTAAQEARQAYLGRLRQRMQEAKAGKLVGWQLTDLQRDVAASQLEGEYETMGLRLSPDIKRQICWERQSIVCDRAAVQASSGSGFVSSWEKAFENSRALNQSQYRENCAAAAKGASRICRVD